MYLLGPPRSRAALAVLLLVLGLAVPRDVRAGDPNVCDDPGDSPDVIVGDLYQLKRWGHVADITAFSVGTYSCNVGTCWLNWITGGGQNQHPTIGQNMFRLKDGRFEQIGQSWLKHGFFALSETLCTVGCLSTDGEHLGVNCSDPYSANLNGTQTRLGPKFEVNVATGSHPHPVTDQSLTGDDVFKRLQVHDRDLDPAQNAGASYFVEGQYIAQDDRAAGNHHNNASYRPITVAVDAGDFVIDFAGPTRPTKPAIIAWRDADPTVLVSSADDADGGRLFVGAKATDLGGGLWHYEYAVQNMDSQRAGGSFAVPIPSLSTWANAGFHDVEYHSGEPFDGTDWSVSASGGAIRWETTPQSVNANANALRWGTLYNFRFDCDRPPTTGLVTIGLFQPKLPGESDRLVVAVPVPSPCNGDGRCDAEESCVACPSECRGEAGPDVDGDGLGYCVDCDENAPGRWAIPGEATLIMVERGAAGEAILTWQPPVDPGATTPTYDVLRSEDASDFATEPACLRALDPSVPALTDLEAPIAGARLFYLARARNLCVRGLGTTGTNSFGVFRVAASCP